jgi:hypothetical protein
MTTSPTTTAQPGELRIVTDPAHPALAFADVEGEHMVPLDRPALARLRDEIGRALAVIDLTTELHRLDALTPEAAAVGV